MKFEIRPQQVVREPYRALFDSLDDAIAQAEKVATEFQVAVDVIQLIGTFEFAPQWVPVSESPKKKKMK